MKPLVPFLFVAIVVISTTQAYAQAPGPGPGRVELSIIPAGGFFFKESEEATEPGFKNFGVGGALAININRFVGIEGEVTGGLGRTQSLTWGGFSSDAKTPNLLNYSGNIVFSAANPTPLVPYFTVGVGGLSLRETTRLDINDTETFVTGNVGGGLKWYAGRWGLRADYRFIGVQSKDEAPAFFGRESRYGHRVYGAVILNLAK